jgi:tetratricopeptide (TPR) repeat protein
LGQLDECRRVRESKLYLKAEEKSSPGFDLLQGTLLLAEGAPGEALTFLLRAEKADLQHPSLSQRIGNAYLQMCHWDLAERAFYKALTIDPDSAIAYHGLAKVYLQQADYEQAAEAALSAVGLIYHNPVAHYHLGEALMHLGIYKRAAEAFAVSVAQAPGIRQAHLRLAELYRHHLKQPKKAAQHLHFANKIIQS